jgi:hypothetical protein
MVYRILSCSNNLSPAILYSIWARVTEENETDESYVGQDMAYLKESQFYIACKLVAIYQECVRSHSEDQLTPEMINQLICQPLKYYASFDFKKMESEEQQEPESCDLGLS